MAKSGKKTKKGPKGKRARAKALLEKRWGERVDEDVLKAQTIRRGKSRLLKDTTPKFDRDGSEEDDDREMYYDDMYDHQNEEEIDSDNRSSGSEDEKDDSEREEPSMNSLLSRIREKEKDDKYSHKRRRVIAKTLNIDKVTDDDDVDDMENEDEESDYDDSQLDEKENETENDPVSTINLPNYFNSTFSKAAFSSDEEAEALLSEKKSSLEYIENSSLNLFDSSLELHASGTCLEKTTTFLEEYFNASKTKSASKKKKNKVDYNLNLKHDILKSQWRNCNSSSFQSQKKRERNIVEPNKESQELSFIQASVYPALSLYADVLCTSITPGNRKSYENIVILHMLNHLLFSKMQVMKHDGQKREIEKKEQERNQRKNNDDDESSSSDDNLEEKEEWRDQGYTRPKVLVLLPTRGSCLTFVTLLLRMLGYNDDGGNGASTKSNACKVLNWDRFKVDYGDVDQEDLTERQKEVEIEKGEEWRNMFGRGVNSDDEFKMGLSLSTLSGNSSKQSKKKAKKGKELSVKLYSEFYQSDIILASPLGLKVAMNQKDEDDEDDHGSQNDTDYLSSIEMCVVHHVDILYMQNWDHVQSILEELNQQPKRNTQNTDFSRVRNYILDGQAKYWRQLIFLSKFSEAHIASVFKKHSTNLIGGQLHLKRTIPTLDKASISDVLSLDGVKQIFQRIPCSSKALQGDSKIQYFAKKILPQLLRLKQKHTLIFIPSYFDFVSVRNLFLAAETTSYVCVTEYARTSEISRGRARFHQGLKNIMLYTGRAHFFKRFFMKGVKHLICLGLPEHCEFYPQLMNMMFRADIRNDGDDSNDSPPSCLGLYTKYDAHALERIVGTKNCERMICGEKSSFLFC